VVITTEEQRLAELLKRSVPEPPFELAADRVTVRHADSSGRSWLVPALAAAAVVLVAGAGVGLKATQHPSPAVPSVSSASQQAGPAKTTAALAPGAPAEAPASFNPLVLPVNFGWLPAGFSENQPGTGEFSMSQGPLEVMTTQVSFGASTTGGEGLQVTVAARGGTVSPWTGGGTGSSAELKVIGTAPDINGHPARWLAGGLEWEYAAGGWATLVTGGQTAAQAQAGWGQHCTINIPEAGAAPTGTATPTPVTSGMETCSPLTRQAATLQAELVKVASNLSWTPTPFTFAYKFTRALPPGWTPGSVTGAFVQGVLTASQLDLYSAVLNVAHPLGDDDETLDISGSVDPSGQTFCQHMPGYDATYNGVKWVIDMGAKGIGAGYIPTWTSSATPCPDPLGKHGSSGVAITTDSAADNQVGEAGLAAILPIIEFLPANPADWTTSPLAS
jgi:hypothetical protein